MFFHYCIYFITSFFFKYGVPKFWSLWLVSIMGFFALEQQRGGPKFDIGSEPKLELFWSE